MSENKMSKIIEFKTGFWTVWRLGHRCFSHFGLMHFGFGLYCFGHDDFGHFVFSDILPLCQ
jgi:hypothetical protein